MAAHSRAPALRPFHRHSSPKPIIIRMKSAPPKKHHKVHRKHSRGGVMDLFGGNRGKILMGAFAVGLIQKQGFAANLPKIPLLGETGTIGLAAHFLGGGKPGIIQDIATAAMTIAAYQLGNTGSITGVGDVPDVSGYVAGF
jgi:hypothetical protein